jgi:hypothetical protein
VEATKNGFVNLVSANAYATIAWTATTTASLAMLVIHQTPPPLPQRDLLKTHVPNRQMDVLMDPGIVIHASARVRPIGVLALIPANA